MLGYFRENLGFRLISIFAAIIIWFLVFSQRNPTAEDLVTVPLEVAGLSSDLVVAEKPSTVSIRFQGKSNVVGKLSSRDFSAYISLEDVGKGTRSIQVSTFVPSGVRIVSVQPSRVQIHVDQVTTMQAPVEVVLDGEVSEGCLLETPRITPAEVLIRGPERHLKNIGRVCVNVDCGDLKENYSQTLPVIVEDESGVLMLEWLEVLPSVVDVLVPVVDDLPSKVVPIVVELIGEPSPEKKLDKVLIHPATVKIYGTRDKINEIGYLPLEVDIEGLSENHTFNVELDVAPDLKDNIEFIKEEAVQVIIEVTDRD